MSMSIKNTNRNNDRKTISIDMRMLHSSGVGTYLSNIIPLIIATYPTIKFNLIGKLHEMVDYNWSKSENVSLINCQSPIYSVREQFELVQKIPKGTSLFWSTNYNIPLLYRGKLFVTILDVCHLSVPQHYAMGLHKQIYTKVFFTVIRRKADAILCISNFTAKELIRLTGKCCQEIYPIHLGVNEAWFIIKKNKNPHGKPFLLYVGNVKPHKNLVALMQAFESIINEIPHDLVIVGQKEGFITFDRVAIAKADRMRDRVYLTGRVENSVLQQYFVHADALVFPSFCEGFGLPPLEAMACGCPVITSNAASLPEVCGDAVLYCDPHNPKDIADKIKLLLNNSILRNDLQQKGFKRAKEFTWQKCTRSTMDVIKKILI